MPVSDLLILGDEGVVHVTKSVTVGTSVTDVEQTNITKGVSVTAVPTDQEQINKTLRSGISRVSYQKAGSFASVTSLPIPAFDTVAGNTIVVMFRANGSRSPSATDTAGNTYTQIQSDTSHDPAMHLFVAENVLGQAGNVVTVTFTASQFVWATAVQYAGVSRVTSGVLAAAGGSTDITTSAFSTSAGSTVLVGVSQNATSSYTAGADFTLVDGSINATIDSAGFIFGGEEEFYSPSALSSYTAHITSSVTNQYTVLWVAYQTGSVRAVATLAAGRFFTQVLTAAVTVLATLFRSAGKVRTATVTAAVTTAKQVGKVRGPTVGTAVTRLSGVGKGLIATATGTASDLENISKRISATVTPTATAAKTAGKVLAASVTALASWIEKPTGVVTDLILSCTVTPVASWVHKLTATPVVCAVLTATAKTCDVLGLSTLSDTLIALTVASDGTLTLGTASGGYGSGGYGSYPYGAGTPEVELTATPAIDN